MAMGLTAVPFAVLASLPRGFYRQSTIRWRSSVSVRCMASQRSRQRLRGVVFDMDGTLTEDAAIDFQLMRSRAKIPDDMDILEHVRSLPPDAQAEAEKVLHDVEMESRLNTRLNPRCKETLQQLAKLDLKLGILTRNTDAGIAWALRHFELEDCFPDNRFLISRTWSEGLPKPSGDGIRHIAEQVCFYWF
ncbi:hypothetical protein AAMO2058_001740600 [Amorphochlora amoebiformis]